MKLQQWEKLLKGCLEHFSEINYHVLGLRNIVLYSACWREKPCIKTFRIRKKKTELNELIELEY